MVRNRPQQSCNFSFLTRVGCIARGAEAFWLTHIGLYDLRAERDFVRAGGRCNRTYEKKSACAGGGGDLVH